ncbi:MAG: hypothetical protein QM768_23115 [Agriterribacter sp.]
MPILVHLADERESANIMRNGIVTGKRRPGIFCMPVLQNFYLSHQWLRELKRRGVRTFVGIYFKVDSRLKVYAGKYNEEHKHITVGEAIKEIQIMDDPLGYEIIIARKIEAKEIRKIKSIPQHVGWRYYPGANGKTPCSCEYCIKSTIKAGRIRKKEGVKVSKISYRDLLNQLRNSDDVNKIEDILLYNLRIKNRRSDPSELLFLLDKNVVSIDRGLALSLSNFKHRNTRDILFKLLKKPDDTTREFVVDSLLKLYGTDIEKHLNKYNDVIIQTAIKNWHEGN